MCAFARRRPALTPVCLSGARRARMPGLGWSRRAGGGGVSRLCRVVMPAVCADVAMAVGSLGEWLCMLCVSVRRQRRPPCSSSHTTRSAAQAPSTQARVRHALLMELEATICAAARLLRAPSLFVHRKTTSAYCRADSLFRFARETRWIDLISRFARALYGAPLRVLACY